MDNSGLAQVRAHAGTDGHKDKVNGVSGTKKVKVNSGTKKYDNKIYLCSNKNILLSTKDQVIHGETLQVLDCVQCSYYFVSINNGNKKFKYIFWFKDCWILQTGRDKN